MTAVRYTLIAVLGVLLSLLVYGAVIEPRVILDVREENALIPNLPVEWEGRTIAAVADFQVGMWWANTGMIRRVVQELITRRPAAVLLAGDFIYHPDADPRDLVEEVTALLRPLADSGIPTYAVLGNHDWGLNTPEGTKNARAARLTHEALTAAGIHVLHNEATPLPPRSGGGVQLYIVGIDSRWAEEADPLAALRGVPAGAARVVFMHNPSTFAEIPAGAAPLAIAAHTHGGQIRIPFTPEWSWLTFTSHDAVHADGWIDGYGRPGNHLYVNRGIGFSTLPLRINAPPEITVLTLRRAGR
jgi:predicted MPP superfamily phosphohydrolase